MLFWVKTVKISNQAILDVLTHEKIKDQSELVTKLANQGYDITQASLSRRLKKLGVNKQEGVYKPPTSPKTNNYNEVIKSINLAKPNFIVIRTLPGHANAIAFRLDQIIDAKGQGTYNQSLSSMVGTIAGDDTILVILYQHTFQADAARYASKNQLHILNQAFTPISILKV